MRRARPTARPAPPLTWWHLAVLRACPAVSDAVMRVLTVLFELDRPQKDAVGGAYQEPGRLAEQVGKTVNAFKLLRLEAQQLGLLEHADVPGSKLDYWFLQLPPGFTCPDGPPAGARQEDRRQWVQTHALRLARHLAQVSSGRLSDQGEGAPRTPQPRSRGVPSTPDRCPADTSSDPLRCAQHAAQVSVAHLPEHESAALPAHSVTLKQFDRECHPGEWDTRVERAEAKCDTNGNDRGATREAPLAGSNGTISARPTPTRAEIEATIAALEAQAAAAMDPKEAEYLRKFAGVKRRGLGAQPVGEAATQPGPLDAVNVPAHIGEPQGAERKRPTRKGTPKIDRIIPGVGRIHRHVGCDDPEVRADVNSAITLLYRQANLAALRQLRGGAITPIELCEAYRRGELDRASTWRPRGRRRAHAGVARVGLDPVAEPVTNESGATFVAAEAGEP
jgi:hypothetical protein